MDTRSKKEVADPYNRAIVRLMRNRRDELEVSNDELERRSGINLRTLNRLMNNQSPFKMSQFMSLARALKFEDVGTLWDEAVELAEKSD